MRAKWKFAIGGLIAALALGYLGYVGFVAGASYYYEVGEFVAQKSALADQNVRIAGKVAPGSVEQKGLSLKFIITDGQQELPVTYQGVVPDSFRAGGEVTVEGRLGPAGVFEATNVLPKCASKYVPA